MVESDMPETNPGRLDPELFCEPPLETDTHVAESNRTMTVVAESLSHDPDGVGEINQPGVVGGLPLHLLGDLEQHRDRAQRLREASRAGGLLTDAPIRKRKRLVTLP